MGRISTRQFVKQWIQTLKFRNIAYVDMANTSFLCHIADVHNSESKLQTPDIKVKIQCRHKAILVVCHPSWVLPKLFKINIYTYIYIYSYSLGCLCLGNGWLLENICCSIQAGVSRDCQWTRWSVWIRTYVG